MPRAAQPTAITRRPRLLRQLKPDGPTGFLLPFGSPRGRNRFAADSPPKRAGFEQSLSYVRLGTDGSQTHRWRELDSNLYGAFSVKSCFWFIGGSLFEAGKPFFVPSPNDQVSGARRRGQGTATLAELSGLPLSRACVSQRLDA